MSELTREAWQGIMTLLHGLWPRWTPTMQQIDMYRRRMGALRLGPLRMAIEESAATKPWREPNIAVIEQCYRRIAEARGKGQRKRKATPCPRCGEPVSLGDNDLCEACCMSDLAEMRQELRDLPIDRRAAALRSASDAMLVWQGALGPDGQRLIAGRGERARDVAAARAGEDPATWPMEVVGLAWAAAKGKP